MPAPDAITDIARALCKRFPNASTMTLARRLRDDSNSAITLSQARKRIQSVFGLGGKKNKERMKRHDLYREPRQPGEVFDLPRSRAEGWEPYVLEVTGLVGILSDIHVPFHSETAVRAAVDTLQGEKISGLVLNGDVCDFYAISRWTKRPALRDFRGELRAVREMLGWLRQEFPDIPIVLKAGNHEERWEHWLWQHAPEISDEPEMGLVPWLHLDRHGIELVQDQRPIMAGKLPILHGHEKGKGISAPVNQARGAFLRLHHTVLEGHGHRTSGHCEPDMWGSEVFCWSTGCLCNLRPEYARVANKWNHGFAVATIHGDGSFDVQNLRVTTDGKVRSS